MMKLRALEAPTLMAMRREIFCVLTPCSSIEARRYFRGTSVYSNRNTRHYNLVGGTHHIKGILNLCDAFPFRVRFVFITYMTMLSILLHVCTLLGNVLVNKFPRSQILCKQSVARSRNNRANVYSWLLGNNQRANGLVR
jgi:hypothetical protein